MKTTRYFLYFTLMYGLFSIIITNTTKKAVICVPIADLVGNPLSTINSSNNVSKAYKKLPVCGENNAHHTCPRLHQLLYNEVVEVIKKQNNEICIAIPNTYYLTLLSNNPQITYWTEEKNIRYLSDLAEKNINIQHIPAPVDFKQNSLTEILNYPTITLTMPHYNSTLNLTFSAGTRFIAKKPLQKNRNKKITVFAVDYNKNKQILIQIPTNKCIFSSLSLTQEQQISQYVALIKQWAHQKNGFIPYVWGGMSFIQTMNKPFKKVTTLYDNNEHSWYEFDHDYTNPKSGFDCSGLITRATQLCHIPYFCKNTTTIERCLEPLELNDTLIEGDLILIKGHVMVVSDIKKNLLIEARGYSHGYGKLHEIALENVFDGIKTYADLCDAFFTKKTLYRKDINETVRDSFKDWKILKITSVYNSH